LTLAKAARVVTDFTKDFEAVHTGLIEHHARRDDAGEMVLVEEGKAVALTDPAAFTRDANELMDLVQDVPLVKIATSAIEHIEMEAGHLFALEWLLHDDTAPVAAAVEPAAAASAAAPAPQPVGDPQAAAPALPENGDPALPAAHAPADDVAA
jgi:hypothetical protein